VTKKADTHALGHGVLRQSRLVIERPRRPNPLAQ